MTARVTVHVVGASPSCVTSFSPGSHHVLAAGQLAPVLEREAGISAQAALDTVSGAVLDSRSSERRVLRESVKLKGGVLCGSSR